LTTVSTRGPVKMQFR